MRPGVFPPKCSKLAPYALLCSAREERPAAATTGCRPLTSPWPVRRTSGQPLHRPFPLSPPFCPPSSFPPPSRAPQSTAQGHPRPMPAGMPRPFRLFRLGPANNRSGDRLVACHRTRRIALKPIIRPHFRRQKGPVPRKSVRHPLSRSLALTHFFIVPFTERLHSSVHAASRRVLSFLRGTAHLFTRFVHTFLSNILFFSTNF